MVKQLGCCGIDCGACEGFLATQANDQAALERVAAAWRSEYHNPSITAENIRCDGCMSLSAVHAGWPTECPIRACALERGVANCAVCPDYGCDKLMKSAAGNQQALANLEALRKP